MCEYCGATFSPTGTNQRFCSEDCRKAAARKNYPIAKCEVCGKEYVPKKWNSKYCSTLCLKKAYYSRKPKGGEKECEWCGSTFFATHRGTKYCSDTCRSEANLLKTKISYEENKKPLSPKICPNCNEEFIPKRASQKFCCPKCNIEYRREHKREFGLKVCLVCGKEFEASAFNQKFCTEDCRRAFHNGNKGKVYQYQKDEGIEVKPKKKKKRYSFNEWNNLSSSERWELMKMDDVLKENLKYHISTYGKSETLARWGKLPEDYGKREKK